MRKLLSGARRRPSVALAVAIGLTMSMTAIAQTAAPPLSRWWPSNRATDSSAISLFGNALRCAPGHCDRAASFGVDARVVGDLRIAIDTRLPGFDYGAWYGWRRVSVSASVGGGRSIAVPTIVPIRSEQVTVIQFDTAAGSVRADTTSRLSQVEDTIAGGAVRWSSAEARLTWREDRWWGTALLGRVALAQRGAAVWGGLQLGADLGRGASLLLGVGTTPRLLTAALPGAEHRNVSLGLGFNTSVLSRRPHAPAASASNSTSAAFQLANVGAGRVRIVIRVPRAASVEFASDCTGWKPLDMRLTRDGWVVEVAAMRGLHRANIRVDGGKWITPPGLSSAADEFAGEVGIFVVE